jgi:tetratricopeptide (TPR) repeat protein
MNCATRFTAFLLLALPLASCASATTTLYSGEMDLVAVSGSGCIDKYKVGSRLPLDLTLQRISSNGPQFTGFFSGTDIQSGRFSGNDLDRLQVVYPDEPNRPQGNTLALLSKAQGVDGELREKPQADLTDCYFEKAVLRLQLVTTGHEAYSLFLRQSNLFSAESSLSLGLSLLKGDKPDDALPELTKSLNLRTTVDPDDPARVVPAVSIAIAQLMKGQKGEALAAIRGVIGDKSDRGPTTLKKRLFVSSTLCSDAQYLESPAGQEASGQLMDMVASEFGGLEGVAAPLAACYREMAKEHQEQDEPDLAIELFQKALKLDPDNPDSIGGVVTSFIDLETPAEGRRYLTEHAKHFLKTVGRKSYDTLLSYLYAAEAQQVAIGGDLPRAEELSREAVKVRPGERTLVIELTRILGREGKIPEARALLEEGSKSCVDQICQKGYAEELARQDFIVRLVRRLAALPPMK